MQLVKSLLLLLVLSVSGTVAVAQISQRTSTKPPSSAPSAPAGTSAPAVTPAAEFSTEVADTKVVLDKVEGNATTQTVTLHFVLVNEKANANANIGRAQAVDTDGYSYSYHNTDMHWYDFRPLFTNAKVRGWCKLGKVPQSTRMFQVVNVIMWREDKGDTSIEFRNVPINWQK